jgi:putative Ca2+/H+ antiporter (TMEM165/GDT1 family)
MLFEPRTVNCEPRTLFVLLAGVPGCLPGAALPWILKCPEKGVSMVLRLALTAFALVFLAELGDKTQLAVLALATRSPSPWPVFAGAGAALLASTALAVALGTFASRSLSPELIRYVHYGAGALLIAVGVWTVWRA